MSIQSSYKTITIVKKVIILGSSRANGDTRKVVDEMTNSTGWSLLDLNDYDFSYYDYEHKNAGDDFLPLMREIVARYDTLIFATPVYWYSMSGIMKVFFDRISDLLQIEKGLGRKLRGRKMAAVSCSNDEPLGDPFWFPFVKSARYLGMEYLGHLHVQVVRGQLSEREKMEIDRFIEKINRKQASSD